MFIHLNVSGTATFGLDAGTLGISVETAYPHHGRLRISIDDAPAKPATVAIRIPGWARDEPIPSDLYRFADRAGWWLPRGIDRHALASYRGW